MPIRVQSFQCKSGRNVGDGVEQALLVVIVMAARVMGRALGLVGEGLHHRLHRAQRIEVDLANVSKLSNVWSVTVK